MNATAVSILNNIMELFFTVCVVGFYGGFNFDLDIDKCVLTTDSFIRICGGSEETHVINR